LEGRKKSEENEVFSSFQPFFSLSWEVRNSPKIIDLNGFVCNVECVVLGYRDS
jgi:hypothetical protein